MGRREVIKRVRNKRKMNKKKGGEVTKRTRSKRKMKKKR